MNSRLRFRFAVISLSLLFALCLFVGCVSSGKKSGANFPSRFIIDSEPKNPGEPPQQTAFRNPQHLAAWGYNGQILLTEVDACETFDAIAPNLLPKGGDARIWIENEAQEVEREAARAHAAGIKAYGYMQFILLPKALIARFKDEICDAQGRIDLERPMTQKILRAQVAELFQRCPDLDGTVVRTGEIYLHDTPYHASGAGTDEKLAQGSTAILHGPESHIALLKILREEVCVKRDKMLFYRTWDFGNNFHVNPDYYLKVTDAIAPHSNLVFSIKYTKGDFFRMTPFNPTLGIGRHRQIVEVECQPEYYGKGAHPFYVGDGVINGWEEYAKIMQPGGPQGLRDLVTNKNFAGIWTWSRGGGWEGPYITNELWCALNAYVISHYAENPNRTEEEIFDEFATQQLHLKGDDVAKFRELNLLSAAAILRGNLCYYGKVNLLWARDDFMGAPDLTFFVTNNLVEKVLAEKAECVADWERIESLAHQIHFADPPTQDFVETSCAYGRFKYAIIEQAWTILLYGEMDDRSGHYDCDKISVAIAKYDALWQEWRELKETHPSCPTLYKDVAFGNKPGIGAAVDKYRKICAAKNL